MYEYCLGMRPCIDNPGFKKVKFAPYFDLSGKMTSASGYYDTNYGRITAEWKRCGNVFTYCVSVPTEIECEFDFIGTEIISQQCEKGVYVYHLRASEMGLT